MIKKKNPFSQGVAIQIRDYFSVADPGCLSRILIFTHPGSRIWDPGSKSSNTREAWKKICCHTLFCSHKFHINENNLFLKCWRKKFGPTFKELYNFLLKKLSLSSQKYGVGIRDPEKTYSGSRGQKSTGSGLFYKVRIQVWVWYYFIRSGSRYEIFQAQIRIHSLFSWREKIHIHTKVGNLKS